MANTSLGTPYVTSSDYVTNYPTTSLALANAIDTLPRGLVANPQTFSATNAGTTQVTLATITFTIVSGRRYRFGWLCDMANTAASAQGGALAVYDGASLIKTVVFAGIPAGYNHNGNGQLVVTGLSAGSHTFYLKGSAGASNYISFGTATVGGQFWLEDVGAY